MAFFDKLNDLAKNIGDMTSDALETGKLTSKVNAEKNAAGEQLKKVGEHYYNIFIAGGEVAPEVVEFCTAAQTHFDAALGAQAEIERIRAENEAAKAAAAAPVPAPAPVAPEGITCPSCGTANPAGTKFCGGCGTKLEMPAPAPNLCPACSAEVPAGNRFCPQCGQKME